MTFNHTNKESEEKLKNSKIGIEKSSEYIKKITIDNLDEIRKKGTAFDSGVFQTEINLKDVKKKHNISQSFSYLSLNKAASSKVRIFKLD